MPGSAGYQKVMIPKKVIVPKKRTITRCTGYQKVMIPKKSYSSKKGTITYDSFFQKKSQPKTIKHLSKSKVFASLGLCKSRFFTKTHSSKLANTIDFEGFLLDLGYASVWKKRIISYGSFFWNYNFFWNHNFFAWNILES